MGIEFATIADAEYGTENVTCGVTKKACQAGYAECWKANSVARFVRVTLLLGGFDAGRAAT